MKIYVKLGEPLWRIVGARRLTVEWPDEARVGIDDVLARLAADYPGFAAAYGGQGVVRQNPYRVFVDAVPIEPAPVLPGPGLPVPAAPAVNVHELSDGQTIFIMLPAIGG